MGLGRAVHADSVRESLDRGQFERPRTAHRVRAAGLARARAAAFHLRAAVGARAATETLSADDPVGHRYVRAGRCDDGRIGEHARTAHEDARAFEARAAVFGPGAD